MKRILQLATCLLVLLPLSAPAAELYRVELIVFLQPDPPTNEAGLWEPMQPLDTQTAIDFHRYSCLPRHMDPTQILHLKSPREVEDCLHGYLRLNELQHRLTDDRIRLENSRHRILHHIAWQQPALSPEETSRISMSGGPNFTADRTEPAEPSMPQFEGLVSLSRKQVLQLEVDLRYRKPTQASLASPIALHEVALRARRKLRPDTVHYLDHPLLGVLVRVSEVEMQEESGSDAGPVSDSGRIDGAGRIRYISTVSFNDVGHR